MHIFKRTKLEYKILEIDDYLKLYWSIIDTYGEETYENGEEELYIVVDAPKLKKVLIYYLTDVINNELGHDAVIIKNYGELVCFNLTNDEKNEFKTIKGLFEAFYDKIDLQAVIDLINNNACFIQLWGAEASDWLYFNSLYDVEGHDELVNKAINSENTIYYEDASYKIKNRFRFKKLDYI